MVCSTVQFSCGITACEGRGRNWQPAFWRSMAAYFKKINFPLNAIILKEHHRWHKSSFMKKENERLNSERQTEYNWSIWALVSNVSSDLCWLQSLTDPPLLCDKSLVHGKGQEHSQTFCLFKIFKLVFWEDFTQGKSALSQISHDYTSHNERLRRNTSFPSKNYFRKNGARGVSHCPRLQSSSRLVPFSPLSIS